MAPGLARADLLFGNMESVALPPDFPPDKVDPKGLIAAASGPECAAALKRAGFTFLNMAANHVLDAGTTGMLYTQATLRDAGIMIGGIGRTQTEARQMQIVEKNGLRFGFLCYCEDNNYSLGTAGPGHAYYETDRIIADIAANRKKADIIVVSIHADIEFMETPSVPRLRNSRAIAAAGAHIILEHHPHVPQGIEMHQGCLIAYSLGNFVFDSHTSSYMRINGPHTAHSFVLLMDVGPQGVRSFERVPVVINQPPEERPHPAQGDKAKELLAYYQQLDQWLHDEAVVKRNWSETARKYVLTHMGQLGASKDPDLFIRDILPRMLWVAEDRSVMAEDRSVMDEVRRMVEEYWKEFRKGDSTWQRPAFRLNKKV
jgi:poly-gamma-glutamate synthesis protein (capsule biosynthesis protein)